MSQTPDSELPKAWRRFTRTLDAAWSAYSDTSKSNEEIKTQVARLTALDLSKSWITKAGVEQLPPISEDWRTWLLLGGRGAGKTRAGAEWLSAGAQKGARFALVGPSLHDVREVMIEGPSGLRAVALAGNKPRYEVSRRRVIWPRGGVAYAHSAEDPESLRGPEFDGAWCDEFCAWPRAGDTLVLLRPYKINDLGTTLCYKWKRKM
jgi:phage terminase large subunit-like protein